MQLKIDPKGAFPVTRRKDGISRQAPQMKREWKRQTNSSAALEQHKRRFAINSSSRELNRVNFSAVHRSTSAFHLVTIAQSTSWTSLEATTQTRRASNSMSSLTARSLTSSSSNSETKSAPSTRFSISACNSPRSCEPRLSAGKATCLSLRHLRRLADRRKNIDAEERRHVFDFSVAARKTTIFKGRVLAFKEPVARPSHAS